MRDAVHIQDLFDIDILDLHIRDPCSILGWEQGGSSVLGAHRKPAGLKRSEKNVSCFLWVQGYYSTGCKALLISRSSAQ